MAEDANIFSIIETIKDEIRGKSDLSSGNNSVALNTAIDQMSNLFLAKVELNLSEETQKILLYLLIKLLDISISENDIEIVFNFEISLLSLQCIQAFRNQYQEIIHYLAHDLAPINTEYKENINFLEVTKKYLNTQIPSFTIELFLNIIQDIADSYTVQVYQYIGIGPFFEIFDHVEKKDQNKLLNIIKKMIQNAPIDSSLSKYLDKISNLTALYFDQIRQNDIANDMMDIQGRILKKLVLDENNINDSQIPDDSNEDSENIFTFEYTNSTFQLLMRLCLPLFNSTTILNSQKAFKYDGEKKVFRKLINLLALFCCNKNGFRYVMDFIQSPPDLNFDIYCTSQYSQTSQIPQAENSFDFSKLLFIFRDKPVFIIPLIFRIYKGVIKFCFNSDENKYKDFAKSYRTDENNENEEEEMDGESASLFDFNELDDEEKELIETVAYISKSIQPVLLDIAVSSITKDELFQVLRCFSYSLHYYIPHYSKITSMFLFVLQGFAFNKQRYPQQPSSSIVNAINNNFGNNNFVFRNVNNFGNNIFRNNIPFGNLNLNRNAFRNNFNFGNNFNAGFNPVNNNNIGGNDNDNNQNNDNYDDKSNKAKITYNFTNPNGNIINRQLVLRILAPFKNHLSILDSFFLDILQPKKEEHKDSSYMNDFNQFKQIIDAYNSQHKNVKYTKAKLAKVTFNEVIELIQNNEITKVNFLKQGFVNHCIGLVEGLQEKISVDSTIFQKEDSDLLNSVKLLIKYCFSLIKIIPLSSVNSLTVSNGRLITNGFRNVVDYQYKDFSFHLRHFDSLSMVEGLINLKEQGLNKDVIVDFSQTMPKISKLVKTRLTEITWPSQFALFYRAFQHPFYKKKAIKVNGRLYSHMDSQFRVMAEQGKLNSDMIFCTAVNEKRARKSFDSRGFSILTIPEMQVKSIREYTEILSLLTKLHEVFVSSRQLRSYYRNQNEGSKNNYINYRRRQNEDEFDPDDEEEEVNNNNNDDDDDNESNEEEDYDEEKQSKSESPRSVEESSTNANENVQVEEEEEDFGDDNESEIGNELSPLFLDKEFCSMIKYLTIPSEVISLRSASLSTILNYPFLFSFKTRVSALKLLVFPCRNSISLCEREFNRADQDEDDDVFQFDEKVIHLAVDRPLENGNSDEFFSQACEIIKRFAPNPEMFDVEFTNEKGIGKGPTHEFYTLLSRCFCEAKRKLFRNDSNSIEAEAQHEKEAESDSQFLNDPTADTEIDIVETIEPQKQSLVNDNNDDDNDNNNNNNNNEDENENEEQHSYAVNKNVQYCVDKLGMFPSFDADPSLFEVLGLFCAKAIFMECIVDIYFNPAFFKLCRNKDVQLEEVDPMLALSLSNKENLIGCGIFFDYMEKELKENGQKIEVTNENVDEFLFLMKDLIVGKGVKKCVDNFLKGFCQILPFNALNMFTESEISQLLGGSKSVEITSEDFAQNIAYEGGYHSSARAILMLKDLIINDMNDEDRQRLIQFITGFNRLPIGGISALKPKFTIARYLPPDFHLTKSSTKDERTEMQKKIDMMLPIVSTCTNKLRLPSYSSKEIMFQKLNYCMSESGGFQLI